VKCCERGTEAVLVLAWGRRSLKGGAARGDCTTAEEAALLKERIRACAARSRLQADRDDHAHSRGPYRLRGPAQGQCRTTARLELSSVRLRLGEKRACHAARFPRTAASGPLVYRTLGTGRGAGKAPKGAYAVFAGYAERCSADPGQSQPLAQAKAGIVSDTEFGTIRGQARDRVWNGPGSRPGHVWNMRTKRQNPKLGAHWIHDAFRSHQAKAAGPASRGVRRARPGHESSLAFFFGWGPDGRLSLPASADLSRLCGRGDSSASGLGGRRMTVERLCRCHPWGTYGLDVVARPCVPMRAWYARGATRAWRAQLLRGTEPRLRPCPESGTPKGQGRSPIPSARAT